jgi:hypothetical protein
VTPATLIGRLDAAIAGYGETVTLQHIAADPTTGGTTVSEQIDCPAAIKSFGPQSLEPGEALEIQVVVSPTGLGSFEPARDDVILIRGNPSNITQIAPKYYGDTLVRVNLACRG